MEQQSKLRNVRTGAVAALVGAFAFTACGDGGDGESGEETDPGPGYGVETEEEESPPAEDDADDGNGDDGGEWDAESDRIGLAETSLGSVIVDDDERTLYLFTADEGGESTCYDQCAENWPPLLVEEGDDDAPVVDVGEGLDASLVGSVERDDGSEQVTYNGHPLYYWINDAAPGDVDGQGVNDVWYVLDAEGEAVTTSG
ncbi:COG4315 family predicted lipoprotein [Glycomyces xiaoerkulensis]|uniref:COG4315 family predicted lipoprotein n=1 Tax=Glycomyces xiaoerkulensis TaxID=2038139 RepID=UPI0012FFDFFB|nr:hypothetical protein [Glycomyces xiaoerkulensis]